MEKRGRILLLLLLTFFLLPFSAFAEKLGPSKDFFQRFDAAECGLSALSWEKEAGDVYAASIGKNERISVAISDDQVVSVTVTLTINSKHNSKQMLQGVLAALEMRAGQVKSGTLEDEAYLSIYVCAQDEDGSGLCWQPQRSGKKRHASPDCSGMEGPRLLTEAAAEAQGYDRCKKCWKKGKAALP